LQSTVASVVVVVVGAVVICEVAVVVDVEMPIALAHLPNLESTRRYQIQLKVKFIFALCPSKSESRMSIRAKPSFNPVK
jgi:hypothetical protein